MITGLIVYGGLMMLAGFMLGILVMTETPDKRK